MEIWDVLDIDGNRTGKTVQRGTKLDSNEFHLVVHVWISDLNGNFLIQKRAKHLEWMPGIWAATGGAVIHNESSLDAAVRETREELGLDISPDRFIKLKRIKETGKIADIYLVSGAREDFLPIILCDEVADVFWASWKAMVEMVQRNEFVPYEYLNALKDVTSII
ncbi:MAG: NUDIX domain-containing protein [Fibrobacter sp.]|nr:NUDIX domain-containing protein [Fibrobacter sp.]